MISSTNAQHLMRNDELSARMLHVISQAALHDCKHFIGRNAPRHGLVNYKGRERCNNCASGDMWCVLVHLVLFLVNQGH